MEDLKIINDWIKEKETRGVQFLLDHKHPGKIKAALVEMNHRGLKIKACFLSDNLETAVRETKEIIDTLKTAERKIN